MIYPSIRIEGAILSPDIIDRLEELPGQKPADFGLDSGTKVKDEIARAWADAQDYWRIFQRKLDTLKPDATGTTETRNLWIVPLLGLLKYDLEFQKAGTEINGKNYAISHRITNCGQAPLHIVGIRDPAGLDRKPANATLRMSAHAVVQEFLNLDEQLYGLVTNGRTLRLLRDSSRLIKQSFVEFDLDRIFADGLFADFAILYRLLHATRLPLSADAAAESLIERYHQDSLDSGARIREGLSAAVENAILTFGNGFLVDAGNDHLRQLLASGQLTADNYYKSLLRLIYRLLFLMVIEERGLVFPAKATQNQRDIYARFYSVARLRGLAEKRYLADKRQSDLWLALLSTFRLFEAGGPGEKLGLAPLAGDLFRDDALGHLEQCQLGNDALLGCLRSLGLYEHPTSKQLIRVNYAALNVEEFGSVYEGLLKYVPRVAVEGNRGDFILPPGDDDTQSHYTPDDLVQPLIKHSLDHLIAACLTKPDPEQALLDLRVIDISCGSGHILLAAARRIATELAIVRTGEEQPSPTAYRSALRDTIRSCIYGVDLNPLAVELCKVALWLEAHNPGEPLNFLDHRIKCGNAIVGYVRREEVDAGVPDEAFAKLPGDDPEVAKKIRARNKSERKSRDQKKFAFTKDRQGQIDAVLDRWKTIAAMPERVPAEIDAKKDAFDAFMSSGAAFVLKQIASIPIAQFYLPRTKENEQKLITDEAFREYWSGNLSPQGQAPAAAVGVATKKRFFHWFLEFPEIVQRGGFDCILGNPPYLGGQKLAGQYGDAFVPVMRWAYAPAQGWSDLVTFFIRRSHSLLKRGGLLAIITTNSICQGDTCDGGLRVIVQDGQIIYAQRSVKWPGVANVSVSLLSVSKGAARYTPILDGQIAASITPSFTDGESDLKPLPLAANAHKCFKGFEPNGEGFVLARAEATALIAANKANSAVVRPFITGKDITSNPLLDSSRWIIDFDERSQEEASCFAEPFRVVEQRVFPERSKKDARKYPRMVYEWWKFWVNKKELRECLGRLPKALAQCRTSKTHAFVFCDPAPIYSTEVIVTATDRSDIGAVLQSTLHEYWAWRYTSTLEGRRRYAPTDCFETFAFPEGLWQTPSAGLADIGERYHEHRRQLMLSLWLGLTDVYNLFHSQQLDADLAKHFAKRAKKDPQGLLIPEEHRAGAVAFTLDAARAGIVELRRLHVELDTAVRDAYGWQDLPLEHDFYEVETLPESDRVRYTISPAARKELLKRLLAENHRRAAAESAAQAQTPPSAKKGAKRSRGKNSSESGGLFANQE